MPLPPLTEEEHPEPTLEFSYVECLMYSLHRLARQCPDILTKDPDKLKDFRLRYVCSRFLLYAALPEHYFTVSFKKIIIILWFSIFNPKMTILRTMEHNLLI